MKPTKKPSRASRRAAPRGSALNRAKRNLEAASREWQRDPCRATSAALCEARRNYDAIQ
jgi:hypothetical protein